MDVLSIDSYKRIKEEIDGSLEKLIKIYEKTDSRGSYQPCKKQTPFAK